MVQTYSALERALYVGLAFGLLGLIGSLGYWYYRGIKFLIYKNAPKTTKLSIISLIIITIGTMVFISNRSVDLKSRMNELALIRHFQSSDSVLSNSYKYNLRQPRLIRSLKSSFDNFLIDYGAMWKTNTIKRIFDRPKYMKDIHSYFEIDFWPYYFLSNHPSRILSESLIKNLTDSTILLIGLNLPKIPLTIQISRLRDTTASAWYVSKENKIQLFQGCNNLRQEQLNSVIVHEYAHAITCPFTDDLLATEVNKASHNIFGEPIIMDSSAIKVWEEGVAEVITSRSVGDSVAHKYRSFSYQIYYEKFKQIFGTDIGKLLQIENKENIVLRNYLQKNQLKYPSQQ